MLVVSSTSAQFPSGIDANDLDGRNGFTVTGYILGEFGHEVAGIGDVNADGIDDIIAGGTYLFDPWVGTDMGLVHVVFGRRMGDGDIDADIDLDDYWWHEYCIAHPIGGGVAEECHPFDFDKDNDIDHADFGAFQKLFGTPP